jgi:hypothetical protein
MTWMLFGIVLVTGPDDKFFILAPGFRSSVGVYVSSSRIFFLLTAKFRMLGHLKNKYML